MRLSWLTYVFPAVTLLFIALFFLGCPDLKTCKLSFDESRRFDRRDALVLGIITAVYAAVAFYGLGDTEAPESFSRFESGDSAVLELERETDIGSIFFYTGLNTGSYTLEYSHDGEHWQEVSKLSQGYADLFKWKDAEFNDGAESSARYIRLTAVGSDLYLGELCVRAPDGSTIAYSCDRTELCDESALVPESSSYLNSSYFDEIYHARTAFENLNGVYPYEVSHPPLGKLIIALGISLFGMCPFGWRFMGVLFGVLMLPALYVFLKRMFGGTVVPACGTAIFAFDFMHFTQTRLATIDTYGVFFIILMYLFMYLYVTGGRARHLALSGICFGLGAACKWTCIYAGAGLGVIWLLHWISVMVRKERSFGEFFRNCLFCLVFFVFIPCLIYYLSYYPYGIARGTSAPGMFFDRDYLDIVLQNQEFMFTYHSGVTAEHPYSSRWYQWIIDQRPILYYLEYFDDGTRSSFGAFLNPVLCWAGLVSVVIMGWLAVSRRDKTAAFIFIGYLAQLLPWVFITRITFEYHYFPSAVFLLLALAYIFALMRRQALDWKWRVGGLTALSLILFAAFYPVLSGARVNAELAGSLLGWLPSWPF